MTMDFRIYQNWQRTVRIGLFVGALGFMAVAALAAVFYQRDFNSDRDTAKADLQQRSDRGADQLRTSLGRLEKSVNDTWNDLTEAPELVRDRQGLEAVLLDELKVNAELNGLIFVSAAGPCPEDWASLETAEQPAIREAQVLNGEVIALNASRASGDDVVVDFDVARLDRPYYCLDWYLAATEADAIDTDPSDSAEDAMVRGAWVDPRTGQVSNVTLAFYSRAIVHDGKVTGVLLGTTPIDNLSSQLKWAGVSPHGYSFITLETGGFLTHPIGRWANPNPALRCSVNGQGGETSVDRELDANEPLTCEYSGIEDYDKVGESGKPVVLDFTDPITAQAAFVARSPIQLESWKSQPVASSGVEKQWTFAVVDFESSAVRRDTARTKWLQVAGLGFVGGALAVLAFAAVLVANSGNLAWVLSSSFAIATFTFTGWIWVIQTTGVADQTLKPTTFVDVARDAANAEPPAREADAALEASEQLTVGLFVQSLEFTGANDVAVSGLIWQSGDSGPASTPPIFPEATSPPELEVLWGEEGETSFGWQFSFNLRQQFDYGEYPLDQNQIWLQMWPGDFAAPTVLLPDLDSFLIQAPASKPGLADNLVLEGWHIERSYFASDRIGINTELGALRSDPDQLNPGVSQLYFVVDVKRKFVGPFVSQLIPLAAINLMLFAALMLTKDRRRRGGEIEDSFTTIGYVAALFFSVIVSHNDLRSRLESTKLVFLENFYFTTYLLLIFVAVNSLIPAPTSFDGKMLERSNLWPKLAFWPVFGTMTLLATLGAFL